MTSKNKNLHLGLEPIPEKKGFNKIQDKVDETSLQTKNIISPEEEENNIKLENEIREKKLALLLNHFLYLKVKYDKLIEKHPDKIEDIKELFINIGSIKTSSLHSKNKLEEDIFKFLERQNLYGFSNYVNNLLGDGEGKKGFPLEIAKSLLKIQKTFEVLIPNLIED